MAKIKLGSLAGAISGRVGNLVYSHNRGGAYIRQATIPTKVDTLYTMGAREAFSDASSLWLTLTSTQQTAWKEWCKDHPIIDRLGEKVVLSGNAGFIQVNALLLQAGLPTLTDPGIGNTPESLTTLTFTADIGAGNFDIAFTPTPCPAGLHLYIEGALRERITQTYLRNSWRLLTVTAAAVASPVDLQNLFTARFGTLQVGQVAHVRVRRFEAGTGLMSAAYYDSAIVEETS